MFICPYSTERRLQSQFITRFVTQQGAVSDLLVDISTKMDKDYALAYLSCSDKSEIVDVLASQRQAEFFAHKGGDISIASGEAALAAEPLVK